MNVRKEINTSELELKCLNHEIAWHQRENELAHGLGTEGTMGYGNIGCYGACKGYDLECPAYMSERDLMGEEE